MKDNTAKLRLKAGLILLLFTLVFSSIQAQIKPFEVYGDLFVSVQMKSIFPDSKTFVDCTPKIAPEEIMELYQKQKPETNQALKDFVFKYFEVPGTKKSEYTTPKGISLEAHIDTLWQVLSRPADEVRGSLLALPNPYIVPGGRFREIYYWDSYFTMLGLQVAGEIEMIENMVANFAHLIDEVGFIPNGNRSYYLGRSQPPFFSLMVTLLAEEKGDQVLSRFLSQLEKEYAFWMDGQEKLVNGQVAYRRVVALAPGVILNRYWDDIPKPRSESYKEDVELSERSTQGEEELYHNLRAACESGWDFSSRWFADPQDLGSIQTTEIIPVDLNALLYHLETVLAKAYQLSENFGQSLAMNEKAEARKKALNAYCWDKKFYTDYNWKEAKPTAQYSLAATYPLFFEIAPKGRAKKVRKILRQDFLKAGGLLTTLVNNGQQWDAPNAWAPLQWMAVKGLQNYELNTLADEIKSRWIALNRKVFEETGKLVEKYNVLDTDLKAGGGEYPLQDGFGWTNGVLLRMLKDTP